MAAANTVSRPRLTAGERRGRSAIATLVKAAGLVVVAISIAVLGAGGTFAYLNASVSPAAAGTASSGSLGVAVSGSVSLAGLYPGSSSSGTITVTPTTTGTNATPTRLYVDSIAWTGGSAAFQSAVTISVGVGACGSVSSWVTYSGGSQTGALAATSIASGTAQTLCLKVDMGTAAANSTQASTGNSFSVVIGGQQT